MAKKPSKAGKPAPPIAAATDTAPGAEPEDDDSIVALPLDLVSPMEEEEGEIPDDSAIGEEVGGDEPLPDAPATEDEIVVTAARRQISDEARSLMGDSAAADEPAADVIDAGNELVLWAFSPAPDAVAVMPDIDFSEPEEWLEALEEIDLPPGLEVAIEKLARAAVGGDGAARRRFMAEVGQLLASAGVETLAVRKDNEGGVFDWVALSPDDIARERDGEPWSPRGEDNGLSLRPVGVSLGMGGRLSLWPTGPSEPLAENAARPGEKEEVRADG